MRSTIHSLGFLVKGPLILLFLVVINLMTSPGHWWVQWPALGIGIAWVFSLFRVLRAIVLVGGLAGLAAYLSRRNQW
jgi:2TM domain-containing protein